MKNGADVPTLDLHVYFRKYCIAGTPVLPLSTASSRAGSMERKIVRSQDTRSALKVLARDGAARRPDDPMPWKHYLLRQNC